MMTPRAYESQRQKLRPLVYVRHNAPFLLFSYHDLRSRQTAAMALKLVVLSVCVALAGAFVPMAAPLSSRPVAASPACSGITMIRAPLPPEPMLS